MVKINEAEFWTSEDQYIRFLKGPHSVAMHSAHSSAPPQNILLKAKAFYFIRFPGGKLNNYLLSEIISR